MAASIGEVTLRLQSGNTISWPGTVAGKIQEGAYKVQMMEYFADEANRDIDVLQKQVEGPAAAMQSGLRLDDCCIDLKDMRKACQEYRGSPLSDAERRFLTQIRYITASAITDYKTLVGRLDECCVDLEDMRKARQEYRAGPLSDAERRFLTQIRYITASAIADYKTLVGPVPDYRRLVTMFSDTIPFELLETLANDSSASHHK